MSDIELESTIYDEFSRLNNELVAMQRELAKKNAELERLNREKNYFLGMAAHDLRSPLQSILMQSEFLLEGGLGELNPEQCEFLNSIRASGKFLITLVNNLLDVAKIEAGKFQLELATVDLEALVTKNVILNRVLAAQKRTTIDLDTEPLPPVSVDAVKIEQVLNNLISNAVKFSPSGSKIVVRLEREATHFRLSVRDQGPGISPEEQEILFQPFSRGQARSVTGAGGTGLGLMIVKRIVEGHGGAVAVESRPGQGCTFTVRIPLEGRPGTVTSGVAMPVKNAT
jgi:signal transduction histidine kinase